ncbi:enoyl-CoA hydratase/isomerase family protein [Consotaella salsifontis]|uniref:3-hydroxyisobutyryl-CoA hydrolase n=1 Tax=Consotaella salsifontis TaxID=1365950 RepID=A0A1T4PXK7_9HYPH|nr:enoyl-CoA hydratase/isomerase family protein [Consotaella salsifontis]SJZ95981.1 enoyl-CoA hydratase [Consotaella salsifontis]
MDGVATFIDGRVGRIVLRRPKALNALTTEMCQAIEVALLAWRDDPQVTMALIEGEGERAFCAGADIAALHAMGRQGDFASAQHFFHEEYRLNRLIAHYPKPYVALMDGIVMGGGVGLSAHGSHRIVTERSAVAMPECAIGLVPDVGSSLLLTRAPGRTGEYLGLTGARMGAADALFAGFADVMVPTDRLAALKAELLAAGRPDVIAPFAVDAGSSRLARHRDETDAAFAGGDLLAIVGRLEAGASSFATEAAAAIRKGSPLSLAATLAIIAAVREEPTVERALVMEYRFATRALPKGEFIEGIRAAVVDKDRQPRWSPARLEELDVSRLLEMLAPVADEGDLQDGPPL